MILKEEQKDLFTVPKDYALVHCISADVTMGAGIAKEFANLGVKDYILHQFTVPINVTGICLRAYNTNWKCICNLVTKQHYYNKPSYAALKKSLLHLKYLIKSDNKYFREMDINHDKIITKLAMPKIGCGLDRLKWDKVKVIIEEVFADTDIEILVCYL